MSHGERTGDFPEVLWSLGERAAAPALLKLSLQNVAKRVGSEFLRSVSWSRTLLQSSSLTVLISLGTQIFNSIFKESCTVVAKQSACPESWSSGKCHLLEHSATGAGMQRNSGLLEHTSYRYRGKKDTAVSSQNHQDWMKQLNLAMCTKEMQEMLTSLRPKRNQQHKLRRWGLCFSPG